MLQQQNALRGCKYEYPFRMLSSDKYGRNVEITINDETDLWKVIDKAISEPSSEKKTIKQIIYEAGIRDTINLLDIRTAQILEWYEAFKYNPTVLNNDLWIWSVSQLNKMQPKLF